MIDTEKYQSARQNMNFVTRSLRSLDNKLHILARQADILVLILVSCTEKYYWLAFRLINFILTHFHFRFPNVNYF